MNKIEKVEAYLEGTDRQRIRNEMKFIVNFDDNVENISSQFNQILITITNKVSNGIEKQFYELLNNIDSVHYFGYMEELELYDSYSEDDRIDRLLLMVKFIDEMKRDLGIESF